MIVLTPFAEVNLGYALTTEKYYDGGFTYSAGAGMGFILSSFINLNIKGNYQSIQTQTSDNQISVLSNKFEYGFVNITGGISFKF